MGSVRRASGWLTAVLLPLHAVAAPVADLPEIHARGSLRILVVGDEDDPPIQRDGTPAALDRDLAEDFARRQGLKLEIVRVERRHDVLDDLLSGRGDVAATGLTVTPERSTRVTFTDPIMIVDEVLIGRKGMKSPPRAPADLARQTVSIPGGSVFEASLAKLEVPGLRIEQVLGAVQQSELIGEVNRGERELAVVDSNVWEAERAWNKDAVLLFPIARKRSIAWALHPEARQLKAALDVFIQQRALIAHSERTWSGDLADVKKHRVLRVLTRNNAVSYFLLRGEAAGFDHDLVKRFSDGLDVRLQMVVPPSHADLVPWLLQGRGDVIAASYTVSPERGRQVAFSVPYLEVQELLVQRASEPLLGSLADLRGRRIRVRPGSSYQATLERLRAKGIPLTIELARSDEETEQLIAEVAAGEVDLTVADSHILQAERVWRTDVAAAFPLEAGERKQLAFAVRPKDRELKAALDRFVRQTYKGLEYNMSWRRYFEDARIASEVRSQDAGTLQGSPASIRCSASTRSSTASTGVCSPRRPTRRAAWIRRPEALPARWACSRSFRAPRGRWASAAPRFPRRARTRASSTWRGWRTAWRRRSPFSSGCASPSPPTTVAGGTSRTRGSWPGRRRSTRTSGSRTWSERCCCSSNPRTTRTRVHGYVRGTEPVRYVSEIQTRYENYLKLVP